MSISLKKHNTGTYRQTTEKITNLSTKRVTLEEKIQIFERFSKTGEELLGNTKFEGHPIGQWAIQIRNTLKRMKEGKEEKRTMNLTEEQLERLESLGILERRIDSTIDEKIDALIAWRKKYPEAQIVPASREVLSQYVKTEEEQQQILEEYEKMQKYYEYIRARKSQGKLDEEQILKCKEGDVEGVFGYPTKIEELAQKYNVHEKDMDYILTKYGTLDNFYEMYKEGKIEEGKDIGLGEKIIKDVLDMDGNPNRGYDRLWKSINEQSSDLRFYSSEQLKKVMEELTEREKRVLDRRFGLTDEKMPKDLDSIGKEMSATKERVRQIEAKALRKLKHPARLHKCSYNLSKDSEFITDEERKQLEEIEKDIQLQNGDLSENLEKLKSISGEIEKRKEEKNAMLDEELKQLIIEGKVTRENLKGLSYDDLIELGVEEELAKKISQKIEEEKRLNIDELEFSVRTYNILKRAKIESLSDLVNMTEEQLLAVGYLRKENYDEIIAKMAEYGVSLKGTDEQDKGIKEDVVAGSERSSKKEHEGGNDEFETPVQTGEVLTDEQEEIKLEDMTPEQLQEQLSKNMESDEETSKQELLQKILEQQKIIAEQQQEIDRLRNLKTK